MTITVPIVAALVAIAAYLNQKTEARSRLAQQTQEATRLEIKTAVDNLAAVLLEKLETKDAVNQLRLELTRTEVTTSEQISSLRREIAAATAVNNQSADT